MFTRRRWWWLSAVALACLGVGGWWMVRRDVGDVRLRASVHESPPVPIVFTSRSEPASFLAAAPHGEVFVFPGQPLWQAREGRLRLLTPQGTVHELTWGNRLPDGGTLIDVMSPSVSVDAKKIVFAGRRSDDHGHFRLYEIGIDGRGLRQLTGGGDDPGCTAVPPMRYAADGRTILPEDERRRIDYDDVDPVYADTGSHTIAFVSSRTPDLGRGHSRRSTTLWLMHLDDGKKFPLTANRYNDRWPFLMTSNYLAFSLWSHNQEVIAADEKDIRPHEPGKASATSPVDSWLGAFTQTVGGQFGALVKTEMPVWRPRPLFNGRIVFMTTDHGAPRLSSLRVMAAEAGLLQNVASARAVGQSLPSQESSHLSGPAGHDKEGRAVGNWATPSPCPPHHVVLAGAPWKENAEPLPRSYGIYLSDDSTWGNTDDDVTLLFDDPDLVDAEPAAVYVRHSKLWPTKLAPPKEEAKIDELRLANGTTYRGPAGTVFNSGLYTFQHGDLPGQKTDIGQGPIFAQPPKNSIHSIKIYASRRDRFDDPVKPRIAGDLECLIDAPVNGDSVGTRVPAGVPTVLAGFDRSGRVVRWTTDAKDSQGRQASFYAFAGDHYSATRPMGKHFCIGCHPGHSSLARADHNHAEKAK